MLTAVATGAMRSSPGAKSSTSMTVPSVATATARRSTNVRICLALCLALWGTTTRADNPLPPVPEGGLMVIYESECQDTATGVEGYCVVSQDRQGNQYVIFAVEGEVKEIRQVTGDTYVVIWALAPGELT